MKGFLPFAAFLLATCIEAHREHKIHNIVLYPDKHSWCKTLPIKQVISHPGCKSIEIDNHVCVGACFSYSIPHTEPSDPGEVIVPYCDSCQPSETRWEHVTLDCQEAHQNDYEQPARLIKRVQHITNCSCTSCEKNRSSRPHGFIDSDDDSALLSHDVPDLLDSLHLMNESETAQNDATNHHRENLRSILNNTLMGLLKNIQENNSPQDKAQLKDLLKMIRDQSGAQYSDESIAEIVESFNSDQIPLDIPKLKEILFNFELSKHNHGLYHHTADDSSALDSIETNEVHHYDKPQVHHKAQHPHHPHHHHAHHHRVGEMAENGAHLARGPHGALVIEPPNHSQLDVNPHELKPNHAGTLLSYDSHPADVEQSSQDD